MLQIQAIQASMVHLLYAHFLYLVPMFRKQSKDTYDLGGTDRFFLAHPSQEYQYQHHQYQDPDPAKNDTIG